MKKKLTRIDLLLIVLIFIMLAPVLIAGWKASYSQLTTLADGDAFLVLDLSDTTMNATGTQKYLEYSDLIDNIDNFDVFGFPYGTSPTVDAEAECAWDTTDDQLVCYDGSAVVVFTNKHRECFTLEDPADADDNVPIFSLDDGFTVTRLDCIVSGGTSAVMVLNDGTNNLDSMTCATTETSDTSLSNATFTALEKMELDVGTVTGSVDWVRMCFTYTITRE